MNRRLFLRSAASTLWLPMLRSAPGMAAQPTAPRRTVWFFVPNGFLTEDMKPTTTGSDYVAPAVLSGTASIRDRMTVLSEIDNVSDREASYSGSYSTHESCVATLLTDKKLPANYYSGALDLGVSVDQYAVQQLRPPTPYGSLQLGMNEQFITTGSGNLDTYYDHISWANATTPLAPLSDLQGLFERMFGGADAGATEEEIARRLVLRKSVLDGVNDRAKALSSRLDAADRGKLDQYQTAVRELEVRLQTLSEVSCEPPDAPQANLDYPERLDAMFDFLKVVLACDYSRVVTFMAGTTTSLLTFPSIGVTTDHHTLSHDWAGSQSARNDLLLVQKFYVDKWVRFCQSLADTSVDGGDLLSSTMVSLVSEFAESNSHLANPMMMLTAGGEDAGFRHGRHLDTNRVPHANYLRATLEFMGADSSGFGQHATGVFDLT
jgi:hypothetical protein